MKPEDKPLEPAGAPESETELDSSGASPELSNDAKPVASEEHAIEAQVDANSTPKPVMPTKESNKPRSRLSGLGWLVRVGINAAATVAVTALILFLIGLAQKTGWVTADGFSSRGKSSSGEATSSAPKPLHLPDDVHAPID